MTTSCIEINPSINGPYKRVLQLENTEIQNPHGEYFSYDEVKQ